MFWTFFSSSFFCLSALAGPLLLFSQINERSSCYAVPLDPQSCNVSSASDDTEAITAAVPLLVEEQEDGFLPSALQMARRLKAPVVTETSEGETEGAEFWATHSELLRRAWREWEDEHLLSPPSSPSMTKTATITTSTRQATISSTVKNAGRMMLQQQKRGCVRDWINGTLSEAVDAARFNPNGATEQDALSNLWSQAAPGVYQGSLLQPSGVSMLRHVLDAAAEGSSGIPVRRPNGMNRYGLLLDSRIDGAVCLTQTWDVVYKILVEEYIRPIGRLLFPDYIQQGDDVDAYAFTIQYKQGEDVALAEHSDQSTYTININLNTEEEHDYEGSSLYFVGDGSGNGDRSEHYPVQQQPGTAVIHRGITRHAALPIERGTRTNLVIWLFGKDGYVRVAPYAKEEQLTPAERWAKPRPTNPAVLSTSSPFVDLIKI